MGPSNPWQRFRLLEADLSFAFPAFILAWMIVAAGQAVQQRRIECALS